MMWVESTFGNGTSMNFTLPKERRDSTHETSSDSGSVSSLPADSSLHRANS
jgi:hypothetical protein